MLLEKMKKWYTKVLLEKMIKKWYTKMLLEKNDKKMIHKNAAGKKSIKNW